MCIHNFPKMSIQIPPHFEIVPPRAFAYAVPNRLSHMNICIWSERGERYLNTQVSSKNIKILPSLKSSLQEHLPRQCQIDSAIWIYLYILSERGERYLHTQFSESKPFKFLPTLKSSLQEHLPMQCQVDSAI